MKTLREQKNEEFKNRKRDFLKKAAAIKKRLPDMWMLLFKYDNVEYAKINKTVLSNVMRGASINEVILSDIEKWLLKYEKRTKKKLATIKKIIK